MLFFFKVAHHEKKLFIRTSSFFKVKMICITIIAKYYKTFVNNSFNLYRHTLFTPLYATRGSIGQGNI